MAGIEKICEYSGEYPGWKMYGYKRNLIQIMPEYRKLFRNKYHILFIFQNWNKYNHYCLFVPSMLGKVDGWYCNYTYHLPTAKRKLKRMLRSYKGLNIKHIPMPIDIWQKLGKKREDLLEYI